MSEIRVLIVEDEPIIAEHISGYLNNNDFKVSGIAYDSEEARRQLLQNTPDVVLLDINLGETEDGIDIAGLVRRKYRIPVLFLTSYADRETIHRAKQTEPGGYLVKPFEERALLASLEIALYNFAKKSNQTVPVLSFKKINRHLIAQISEREFEVMQLIFEGLTNQQIAERISISVNTIKKHINSSYLKLDVATRTTAIARLLELMTR
ncbi:MAG: response regulator transcription factor [Gemmatimonadaceae bacterium]|nr:response regulator transcription factor [Chitinophagaceae bacterium]